METNHPPNPSNETPSLPKHLAMFALNGARGSLDAYLKKRHYFLNWNEEQKEAFYAQYPGLKGQE
jgi:hypothetical protein